jgi:hypothetical protein
MRPLAWCILSNTRCLSLYAHLHHLDGLILDCAVPRRCFYPQVEDVEFASKPDMYIQQHTLWRHHTTSWMTFCDL